MSTKKTIEFIGVPSGDYESFVWNVTKDTYKTVCKNFIDKFKEGHNLSEDEAIEYHGRTAQIHSGLFEDQEEYMIYPDDIIDAFQLENKYQKIKFTITAELINN